MVAVRFHVQATRLCCHLARVCVLLFWMVVSRNFSGLLSTVVKKWCHFLCLPQSDVNLGLSMFCVYPGRWKSYLFDCC